MQNARSIQAIAVLVIGVFLALWLGVALVTDQIQTVARVAGVALLLTCVFLGPRIWLLLLVFMSLQVPFIRGFTTAELGQGLFIGFCIIMFLMRRLPLVLSFDELSLWRIVIALVILQVYVRHPVGLNIFGAGSVGARPYFVIILAFLTSFVLGNLKVRPGDLKWAMRLSFATSLIAVPMNMLRGGAPAADTPFGEAVDEQASSRIGPFVGLATPIPLWVVSFVSPLKGLLHPLWGSLILFSMFAAAASGYRNAVAAVGLTYLLGIAYRGGLGSVLLSSFFGALGLAALALWNVLAPLPPNIQRALSPFPGTWETRHSEQAETSTQWRVEMWKEALFTENWIQNKILGDGLGFTRLEMERMQNMDLMAGYKGTSGLTVQQESMMISGNYHSGPVQTIRTVGYLGLFFLVVAMIRLAVHAHRQIIRCRGTEWLPVAIFFCLPAIATPTLFVFIFGEFRGGVTGLFWGCAIVNLLQKNLPLPAWVKPVRRPYLLPQQAVRAEARHGGSGLAPPTSAASSGRYAPARRRS